MKVKPRLVRDVGSFVNRNGLDPKPVTNPIALRSGSYRIVSESYAWGTYHCATNDKGDRWGWVGDSSFTKVPGWARSLAKHVENRVWERRESAEDVPSGPTERAKKRLSKRHRSYRKPSKDQPDSVKLAYRCAELISARCGRTLAKSQGSSKDGDLFLRNHYDSSKYLSLFVRRGERILKRAQIWPLTCRDLFHIQFYGIKHDELRQMIPPQYEITTWKDRTPRLVVKYIDETGISYVARAIAKGLEGAL